MIKILKSEYLENDTAVYSTTVSFFSIILYKKVETTTNKDIISNLKTIKHKKIKGFNYEVEN
jgi:hypothetical protein